MQAIQFFPALRTSARRADPSAYSLLSHPYRLQRLRHPVAEQGLCCWVGQDNGLLSIPQRAMRRTVAILPADFAFASFAEVAMLVVTTNVGTADTGAVRAH